MSMSNFAWWYNTFCFTCSLYFSDYDISRSQHGQTVLTWQVLCSYRIVLYIKQVMNIPLLLAFLLVHGKWLLCFLIWQKTLSLAFSWALFKWVFSSFAYYNLELGLPIHTRYDDLDLFQCDRCVRKMNNELCF